MKQSVKIEAAIIKKVRRESKKTKQTIGGFFELSAAAMLTGSTSADQIQIWKTKAEKWDTLGNRIAEFYSEDEKNVPSDLVDIGEAAAMAFGFL